MSSKIDLNRGVHCTRDRLTGMYIYMYIDTPGVYLSEHGTPVSEVLAKAAGFDTAKYAKERLRRERSAEFNSKLAAELDMLEHEDDEKVVYTVGGWKVIEVGAGFASVKDPDGNRVTAAPIPVEAAKGLLDKIVPSSKNTAVQSLKKE